MIQSGAINAVPALTLALANSGLPRKPSGSRQKLVSDPFCSTANLRKFLVPFVLKHDLQIDQKSLVSLKTWRDALVDALARPAGTEVSALTLATLNGLAEHVNRVRIFTPGFHVAEKLVCANIAERVAAACLNELALSEASRIKRCMRRECGLFFYDTTRNRSGRWHAEDPCGWRSRDERRRGKSAN